MIRRLTIPVLLFLAVPACGGEVIVPSASSDSTTGSSVGGAGGAGGVGSTGGVGGTSGIGGTGGGAPSCTETHDALGVTLSTWQGTTYDCKAGAGDFELSAQVVENDGQGHLVLDSCSPAADCIPFISKLTITAPSISIDVPKATYVKVHVAIDPFMGGCEQRIQIRNLPVWDGDPNPVVSGDALWFLGVDGGSTAFADTPLTATTQALGCFPGVPPSCGGPEDFSWHFQATGNPNDVGVTVPMGQVAYWGVALPLVYQLLAVHNLRSFSTGVCDGPVDLAYWMAHQYPPDGP